MWPVVAGVGSVRRLCCARAKSPAWPVVASYVPPDQASSDIIYASTALRKGEISCVAGCCRSHVLHLAVRICASTALRKGESLAWPVVAGASCLICLCWLKNATKRYMRGTSKMVEHLHIQKINALRRIYIYIYKSIIATIL